VTKEEFAEWLEENKDEALDMMRDYNKSLILWLSVFHAQLKALAVDVAEDDEILDEDEDDELPPDDEEEEVEL
jgi:hypothetical protein